MDSLNKEQALETAFSAAEAGARELMVGYGSEPRVRHKGTTDLVTEYDLRSEAIIRQIIGQSFPDHLIVGEEEGASGSTGAAYKWYVDPLDGTTNFVHGHPFFAVSICLAALGPDGREEPLVGVIKAPALGDLYWGLKGHGAFRRLRLPGRRPRENRLAVTETADLRSACLNTGFPYDIYSRGGEVLHPFSELIMAARTIRRAGSAALDMAYVATGLADGFWETGLKPWDVAGGMVLLAEAGGQVSDYQGQPYQLGQSRDILGSNGRLHPVILEYLK